MICIKWIETVWEPVPIYIVSYGGLPFSLSRDGFFNGTSVPVNKSLLTVFLATKYSEQGGHGVPTIVEKYGKDVFFFEDEMLKVVIPLAFGRAEVKERTGRLLQKKGLTDNQKKVYDYRSKHPKDSLQDAADNIGLSLAGDKKICLRLQEYGLLERDGSKRDGILQRLSLCFYMLKAL